MNNLYEYIDPIISPYEAFCFDSDATGLPIPAHWHYYVELLYLLEGNVRITIDRVVQTCPPGSVVLFPPRCVHAIGYADRRERVRYHVIKFDPEVLLRSRKEEVDLHASLRNISTSTCPCCFLPEQSAQMNLRPLFEEIMQEYAEKDYAYATILRAGLCWILGKILRSWQKDGYLLTAPDIHPVSYTHLTLPTIYSV